MVSFSFDDSQQNHYDVVRPILRSSGVNGTFYVVGASLTWSGNLTPAEARTMAQEGDELGNHTQNHPVLTSLSSAQVDQEFAEAQANIKAATGVTPETCAYPSGQSNATVQAVAAKYFRACRGTGPGQNSASNLATYDLSVLYAQTSTTAAQVKAAAEQAKANNTWLIIVYHGVGDVYSSDDVTAATLQGHIDAVKAAGVPIRTVKGALAALGR